MRKGEKVDFAKKVLALGAERRHRKQLRLFPNLLSRRKGIAAHKKTKGGGKVLGRFVPGHIEASRFRCLEKRRGDYLCLKQDPLLEKRKRGSGKKGFALVWKSCEKPRRIRKAVRPLRWRGNRFKKAKKGRKESNHQGRFKGRGKGVSLQFKPGIFANRAPKISRKR